MLKYKIITVSKDSNTLLTENDFVEVQQNVSFERILNNTTPITKLYNQKLDELRHTNSHDYLIFIHGDARLDITHFIEHIESVHGKYAIMGLCGTEYVNVSECPLNWYTSSAKQPNKRWGCVTHEEANNNKTFFSKDRILITDHEVGCIDGVCIIFGPDALKSTIKFDEVFMFDQYDTDLSLQCVMNYKMKLGVLVEQSLIHTSVGKSITTNEFLIHELDLRRKWKFEIPKNSKLEMLLQHLQQRFQQQQQQLQLQQQQQNVYKLNP